MPGNLHEICQSNEIQPGERMITEVDGKEIAVINVDGEFHAVLNYCVHQSGPVCEGALSGKMTVDDNGNWQYIENESIITCPWHYWKFDITTGENIRDKSYKIPTFEVELEGGSVYVVTE